MFEKLATHDVQDISELFSLADKCARAAEGHAWHSQPVLEAWKAGKPGADVVLRATTEIETTTRRRLTAKTTTTRWPELTLPLLWRQRRWGSWPTW
jgi:hypothetical protein